jgi:probable HAF family extracellular repeat protein
MTKSCLGLGCFLLVCPTLAAAQYVPVDLGTLGGSVSWAGAISDSGQVVGYSYLAGDTDSHAFSWTAKGGMVDLGTLGRRDSLATAVSAHGQVIGTVFNECEFCDPHAFSWTPKDGAVDLGTLGGSFSWAAAVSDSGEVVGYSYLAGDTEFHAFSWTAEGGMLDLGTLAGGTRSFAMRVNSRGQVVGYSETRASGADHSEVHAFLWTATDGMVDLGTLGFDGSIAIAVNKRAWVIGTVFFTGDDGGTPFVWTPRVGMVTFEGLGGHSVPRAINAKGQVVGSSDIAGGVGSPFHPFSWTASGGMIDLAVRNERFGEAGAVNDHGQVVGYAGGDFITGDNRLHAFSWTAGEGRVDLGRPGEDHSAAVDVNNHGQIVGFVSFLDAGTHAVLWQPVH